MAVSSIVHLIGFPASGKLTIARALSEAASTDGAPFVVLDNHHFNNVIFPVLDLDGIKPVPPVVWDRTREIAAVLRRTIEELSPPQWSFIFTNVLTDDRASERVHVDQLVELAERTDRRYVPVLLHCDPEALTARVANVDRRERRKWIDPAGLREYVDSHSLVDVTDLDPVSIDTGATDPTAAVAIIMDRLT